MQSIIYKVRPHDTFESIAKMYKVKPQNIEQKSFDTGDRVVINLKSKICYVVMPGDDIQKISQKLNINKNELAKILGGDAIFVGKHIVI